MSDYDTEYVPSGSCSPTITYERGQSHHHADRMDLDYPEPGPSRLYFTTSCCRDSPLPAPRPIFHTDAPAPRPLLAEPITTTMPDRVRETLRPLLAQTEARLARPPAPPKQHAVYEVANAALREVYPGMLEDGRLTENHPAVQNYLRLIPLHASVASAAQGKAKALKAPTVSVDDVGKLLGVPDIWDIAARSIVALAAIHVLDRRAHPAHKVLWARDPKNTQIMWMDKFIKSVLFVPQPPISATYIGTDSTLVGRLLWHAQAASDGPVAGRTRGKNAGLAPAPPVAPKPPRERKPRVAKPKVAREPAKDRMTTRRRAKAEGEQVTPALHETTPAVDEPTPELTPDAEANAEVASDTRDVSTAATTVEDEDVTVDVEVLEMPPLPAPPAPRRSARTTNRRVPSTPADPSPSATASPYPIRAPLRHNRATSDSTDSTVVPSSSEETLKLGEDLEVMDVDVKLEVAEPAPAVIKKATGGKNKRKRDGEEDAAAQDEEAEKPAPAKRARKVSKKAAEAEVQQTEKTDRPTKAKRSRARK